MDDIFSNLTVITIFLIFVSYLLCSIPFGLLITKLYGVKDIREIGSGNIGATNVLRTGRKGLALITLILDFLKGFLSISITLYLNKTLTENNFVIDNLDNFAIPITAIFSVIGHCYPVFHKFKGGKGVATGFGSVVVLLPYIALGIPIAIPIIYKTRYVSLGAILGCIISIFLIILFVALELLPSENLMILFVPLLIIYKHKQNIIRLIQKKENKIFS